MVFSLRICQLSQSHNKNVNSHDTDHQSTDHRAMLLLTYKHFNLQTFTASVGIKRISLIFLIPPKLRYESSLLFL